MSPASTRPRRSTTSPSRRAARRRKLQTWHSPPQTAIAAARGGEPPDESPAQTTAGVARGLRVSLLMPTPLFALLVLAGAALYFMTGEERQRLARRALTTAMSAARGVTHSAAAGDPFDAYLRARTRWAIVTPLLVAANV